MRTKKRCFMVFYSDTEKLRIMSSLPRMSNRHIISGGFNKMNDAMQFATELHVYPYLDDKRDEKIFIRFKQHGDTPVYIQFLINVFKETEDEA